MSLNPVGLLSEQERTIPEVLSLGSLSTQFQDFQATYSKPACPSNPNADFPDANIFWRYGDMQGDKTHTEHASHTFRI